MTVQTPTSCWLCSNPLGTHPDCIMCDAYRKDAKGCPPGCIYPRGHEGWHAVASKTIRAAVDALPDDTAPTSLVVRGQEVALPEPALDPRHINARARAWMALASVPPLKETT